MGRCVAAGYRRDTTATRSGETHETDLETWRSRGGCCRPEHRRDSAAARILRHRHRRHRRHLLPAGRHAGAADLQQGHGRRQEGLGHGRSRRCIGGQRQAAGQQGDRVGFCRGRHPGRGLHRQQPVRRRAAEEPACAGCALPRDRAADHPRRFQHQQRARLEGQEHLVGRAGVGPVPAADRPAQGARHEPRRHQGRPVVVHPGGRQDQGR